MSQGVNKTAPRRRVRPETRRETGVGEYETGPMLRREYTPLGEIGVDDPTPLAVTLAYDQETQTASRSSCRQRSLLQYLVVHGPSL